jgi:NAD+ kinase
MTDPKTPRRIRKVLIVGKRRSPEARPALRRVARLIEKRGLAVSFDPETAAALGRGARRGDPAAVDLVVVLGGDGTLLSAARRLLGHPRPILGINLGGLGFMTETGPEEAEAVLEEVLAGRYDVSRRMTLDATLLRGRKVITRLTVLNDAVIAKSALARMIDLEVSIDGGEVTTYQADGLIVSTPTGSTAYSLSAGGPIIHPEMSALLVSPICPHTLTMRPLLVPAESRIEVTLRTSDSDVYLTLDGQVGHTMKGGDRVRVRKGSSPVLIVRSRRQSYYEVLRRKLRWGER